MSEKAGRHGEKAGRKCYLAKVDSRYASGDLLWEILAASHMGKAHTEAWVLGFMDWGGKKMVVLNHQAPSGPEVLTQLLLS